MDFVDSPTDVGDRAADALGMMGSNRILPILIDNLTGNDLQRCRGGQKALMRIKPEGVVKALVDALGDERGWAGHLLGTYHLEYGETMFKTGRVAKLTDLSLNPELFTRL